MRRYAVTVALVTLAACGGGEPAPRATPTPSVAPTTVTPSPTPTPAAEGIVRAAVAKTLGACPCSVEVALWTKDPAESYVEILRGVYDAKSNTTELREIFKGKESGLVVRYVNGRAFTTISRRQWSELLHSGLPAKPVSPFLPLAVGDPRIPFSVAGAVRTSAATLTHEGATLYEVEFDVAAAARAAGPWDPLVTRLAFAEYGNSRVWVRNGLVTRIEWLAPGTRQDREDQMMFTIDVKGTGAKATPLPVPNVTRTRDVAVAER